MTNQIGRLPVLTKTDLSNATSIGLHSPELGADARATLSTFLAWLQEQLTEESGFQTQYASPNSSGFDVNITPSVLGNNVWLILTPAEDYAAGTISLPSPVDGQEVMVFSTRAVSSLTIDGGTTYGAPITLAANTGFLLRYDGVIGAWFQTSAGTTSGGGGGGGVTDGNKGDITVSGGGTVWNFSTSTVSAFIRTLLNDADSSEARSTLGLVLGTNVQAYSALLASIAGLASAADKLPYFNGANSAALADLSSFTRTLTGLADAAAWRTALGVASGSGDMVSNTASSTDGQAWVANGATGKGAKLFTGAGLVSANAGVLSTVAGPTGAVVGTTDAQTLTNKTYAAPLTTGLRTNSGAEVETAAAMAGTVIDVTAARNTKTISADTTFTFSGTPANGTYWGMEITASGGDRVVTIPSCFSDIQGQSITQYIVPAGVTSRVDFWRDEGGANHILGEPIAFPGAETAVATAATMNIGVTPTENITTTGSVTVTSFGSAPAGLRRVIRAGADFTLTHNGTSLICPGAQNIEVKTGDRFGVRALNNAGNWVVDYFTRATISQQRTDLQGTGISATNEVGFRGIPLNSQSGAYTCVAADAGGVIYHPSADTTARIWTIPANGTVAYPIGTTLTFDNDAGAGAITIAITTDTLVLVGAAGSTGSRTLASGGRATAVKVTATRWRISGTELT